MLDREIEDRILKALNHREPDRVPIWDSIDNKAVYDHFAAGELNPLKAKVLAYHGLGIDVGTDLGMSSHLNGTQEGGQSKEAVRHWLGDEKEPTICQGRSPAGAHLLAKRSVETEQVGPKTIDDLSDFTPGLPSQEEIREVEVANYIKNKEAFEPYALFVKCSDGCISSLYQRIGLDLFSVAIYDAPRRLRRLISAYAEVAFLRAMIFAQLKLGPLYLLADDIAYKEGTLFSPRFLKRWWIPLVRKIIRPLKRAGIKVIFHSDGNLMTVLDDLIKVGIDGLHPIEPQAGMDIEYLKRRYGRKLILVGNLDSTGVLSAGSKEDVLEATKDCIRKASPGGGHFIGSSGQIGPATPLENVLAFYEAVREFGKYPIRL